MSELSEKELDLVTQFRNQVDDVLTDEQRKSDVFPLRWLRAREWNVEKAERMLRNSVEWRRQNHIDEILDWQVPEVLRLYYPVGHCGFDNDGCPVLIVPFGRSDIRNLIEGGSKEKYIRYTYQILEQCLDRMQKQSLILEKEVTQIVVVFDLKGLSLRHLTYKAAIDVLLDVVKNYENNYPEVLKAAFAVNAPTVFTILFGIIKPMLTTRTLKKVSVFGHDESKWKKAILEVIPAAQLPKHWGGTREEDDEFCSSLICMGGSVPSKYLNSGHQDSTANGHKSIPQINIIDDNQTSA